MKLTSFVLIASCASLLFSCSKKPHDHSELVSALQQYDRLIRKMDADSIALLYTPDGTLGNVAHGRDSIRLLLQSFSNYRVLEQISDLDFSGMSGDSAYQKGTYQQTTITPDNDTVQVKGTFRINWVWSQETGWRIRRMQTNSLP